MTDEQVRRRIATDLDDTLFVEAGAGSGKTTALISRIIALISSGRARIYDVAAITFTEAAAAELKERLESKLRISSREPALTAIQRERLSQAHSDFHAATISTLHGFAWNILNDYPLEAQLPPGFSVMDGVAEALHLDSQYSEFLTDLLDNKNHISLVRGALAVGIDLNSMRDIAFSMQQSWNRIDDWMSKSDFGTNNWDFVLDIESVIFPLRQALSKRDQCLTEDDLLYQHLRSLVDYYSQLNESANDKYRLVRLLAQPPVSIHKRLGRKANWSTGSLDDVRSLLKDASDARTEMIRTLASQILARFLEGLGDLSVSSSAERLRDGRLTFHDLLVRARNLLRDNESVRRDLYKRYKYLLIDEFQDTDPLQYEIAVLLARATLDGPAKEGALFFVGDPQQAIYRFRDADPTLFSSARGELGADSLSLTQNFRSVPAIVEWVNTVFADLKSARASEQGGAHRDLVPVRKSHGEPGVWLIGGPSGASASELRAEEACDIADAIDRILATQWPVADDNGGWRPASPTDIAILVQNRSPLGHLTDALRSRGLPYNVQAGSAIWSSPELRDITAVLEAVLAPEDQVAVVAALRSSFLACSDKELAEFRLHGGEWSPLIQPSDPLSSDRFVYEALAKLRKWAELSSLIGVSQLLSRILRESRAFEAALARHSPAESWERMRYLQDQARSVERNGGGLRDLLRYVATQMTSGARQADPLGARLSRQGVTIFTMHGAKGLEFPIVLLAALGAVSSPKTRLLWSRSGKPELKMRTELETAGFAELAEEDSHFEHDERLRVAYVAATRARDHLIVSCWHKKGAPTIAQLLYDACNRNAKLWARMEEEVINLPPPQDAQRERSSVKSFGGSLRKLRTSETSQTGLAPSLNGLNKLSGLPFSESVWGSNTEAAWQVDLCRATNPKFMAATALKNVGPVPTGENKLGALADDPREPKPQLRGDTENVRAWHRSRTAGLVGQAVHKVLELVELSSGQGPGGISTEATVKRACSMFQIEPRQEDVLRLVDSALRSNLILRAGACRHWKEMYVASPVGDVVLEGYVDLLFETHEVQPTDLEVGRGVGLCVVDYKTDTMTGKADLFEHTKKYRLQAAAYALAVEQILRRSVTKSSLLFLAPSGAVEVVVEELEAAKEQVRQEIALRSSSALNAIP